MESSCLYGGTVSTSKCSSGEEDVRRLTMCFVGRFAAKEAAIKAHPHRRLTLHEITIVPMSVLEDSAGTRTTELPRLGSGPRSAIIRALDDGDQDTEAMISISHDGDYATAVCMGVR